MPKASAGTSVMSPAKDLEYKILEAGTRSSDSSQAKAQCRESLYVWYPASRHLRVSRRNPQYVVCLCVLAFSQPFFGQSLGDVARKERQKQQTRDTRPAKKVISDEDMPDHPASESPQSLSKDHKSSDSALDLSSEDEKKSAQQWKAEIQAQKNLVASLQKALDRLNSSIHFVDAN